ncbi:formimidoylglutamase [Pedobacter cryoconitis]|uniref:Formimidoylglutamase n=1 Tax=Pedobacter cryoconitis TaxID=188932 RepID=A0A7X0MGK4_9SPHI|nr:formimidoylglutamase [Pedobacter cryoconitis]MBB6498407.1 formiminoglutamase [Pedobacter cryoconitis]
MEKRNKNLKNMINPLFYRSTPADVWTGRNDGTDLAVQRWHQRIIRIDLQAENVSLPPAGDQGIALIGFSCDEGVRRNGGRTGAKDGPAHFRKASCNLPVHLTEDAVFLDLGDIICTDQNMEEAQLSLAQTVAFALSNGYQPFVIGGGHEVAYGHYTGIKNHVKPAESIGIINFDAHFDLREPNENGTNSGTGFLQIARDCQSDGKPFRYLPVGIQQNSNTKYLFDTASNLKVNYIPAEGFMVSRAEEIRIQLEEFITGSTHIYLTICMDVFSSSFAPGVSAAAFSGLIPDAFFFSCLQTVLASGKVISMDIAECNPVYDQDQRTAKLAAALAFRMINP